MNIKILTSAVLATLYGACAMNAAAALAADSRLNILEPVRLSPEEISRLQTPQSDASSMMLNDGLNVQVRPSSSQFVFEEGLSGEHVYIVSLDQQPLAQAGLLLKAKDQPNSKNANAKVQAKLFVAGKAVRSEVASYRAKLLQRQDVMIASVAAQVGGREVRHQFTNAINGFSMLMTQDEAQSVAKLAGIRSIRRAKTYQLSTHAGPELIEADKVWSGAVTDSIGYRGEGIIVGIVDTGINTDHASFADIGGDGYDHTNPWGAGHYVGDCAASDLDSMCNDKLIGVHSYDVITDNFTNGELGAIRPASGEDYQGHGTHTASTAAGNVLFDVDFVAASSSADSNGDLIKSGLFPQISGVAPHANIISYQVCNPTNDNPNFQGCPGEALIAGIEDAISDGVDVINFSIGGQDSNPWDDDVELAFLAARAAGISVATAAGNAGQTSGSGEFFGAIDHASPWLLNVAASTHGSEVLVETKLTSPHGTSEAPKWSEIVGGAINTASVTGLVVEAKDYGDEYCGDPFTADTFANMTDENGEPTDVIVVCHRNDLNDANGIARTVKADNVKAAGGDGMILYNYADGDPLVSLAAYSVPTIHITTQEWNGRFDNDMAGYGLSDWLSVEGDHIVTIGETQIDRISLPEKADWLAAFSSRGPSPSTPEALIPAVSAPGVNIYAAYADEHPFADAPSSADFAFLSGTSMASPHVAGSMALLRQAHPDWTAAEVQSALSMTTDNQVQYHRLNNDKDDVGLASTYRAGTGRINVANAVQAGLIMDETADNFKAADPHNGGAVHKLNLPQLVNFNCKPKCQWIRTVKATKDGSWTVDHDDVVNWHLDMNRQSVQNGVTIKVSPVKFSLKAGETQSLVIEASIMDTQDIFSNAEVELHSNLIFTENTNQAPQAHWPIVFKYDMNGMPANLVVNVHRNMGNAVIKELTLPENDAVYGRAFTPVKLDVHTVNLPKDDDNVFPWDITPDEDVSLKDRLDEATHIVMIEVPEGAKRLLVESLGTVDSELEQSLDKGNLLVFVGKDYNGNGQADPLEEILCVSSHVLRNNFCNINQPEAGTYWAVFYNPRKPWKVSNSTTDIVETFEYATTIVTDTLATDLSVDVPVSNGKDPVDISINWDMPEMAEGDVYYSLLDFGSSQVNAGNIGKVGFKLTRGKDDVRLDVPQSQAHSGDRVPVTFEIQANDSGKDRAFSIVADIPDGLDLSLEDVLASSQAIVTEIMLEDGKLSISGIQPDTSAQASGYAITTSLEDAQCRTPDLGNENVGGYVDLEEFGFDPIFSGFSPVVIGDDGQVESGKDNAILSQSGIVFPIDLLFGGTYSSFHLYNNTNKLNVNKVNALEIRGNGVISLFEGQSFVFPGHSRFPYNSFPSEAIGMLWRGWNYGDAGLITDIMSVPLINTYAEKSGITLASTQSGWGIVEFDNARSYGLNGREDNGAYLWQERDDRFDFELLFNVNTRFGDGEYELIMAYDNIDFGSQDTRGSIGLQGFTGAMYIQGPVEGYRGESYAYNDLDTKLSDGLVICYDYVGPESSQFEVTAWTQVKENTAGKALEITALSKVDGMSDSSLTHTIQIPSNLSIGVIADQRVEENTRLAEIQVQYVDELNSVDKISVSGEHMTAVIDGDTSGSSFSITPEANFFGEIEVTVTVSDVENPSDKVSTSFMLTVISDGIEPAVPPTPKASSSGGTTGYCSLLFLLLACINRYSFRLSKQTR